jgi:hypothetical protein
MKIVHGIVSATCFALASIPTVISADVLPAIPVKVEVGLDEGTKALLESLPIKMREQFIIAVNAAMDRVDFSVERYVRDIQLAAIQTTQDVSCTAGGALIDTGNDLVRGVTTLLVGDSFRLIRNGEFTTPPGVDASSQVLLKSIVDTQRGLKADTSTSKLFATYSDLAFKSATLICQFKARNAPTDFGEDQLRLMRKALGEWRLLNQNGYCSNPTDCVTKRKHDVDQIIAREQKENPALIEAATVTGEFQQLGFDQANPPVAENDWYEIFNRLQKFVGLQPQDDYDITRTESILYGLRDIELKIAAQKANWQWKAQQAWATAKSALDPLPRFLTGIAEEMNPNASGYNIIIDSEHAFTNLGKVKKQLFTARAALEQAKSLDPRLKKAADDGLNELQALEKDAQQKVEKICGIYLADSSQIRPGFMRIKIFDDRYGAYKWCNTNKTNRWDLFPARD